MECADDESSNDTRQCCGSGCNNCILDQPTSSSGKKLNSVQHECNGDKTNILSHNYTTFRIDSIKACTKDVHRFTLRYLPTQPIELSLYMLYIPAGHHVMVRFQSDRHSGERTKYDTNTEANYCSRWYTPIMIDSASFGFDVLVKFQPGGEMSELWRCRVVGDACEVKGAYGEFVYTPNTWKRLVCICQGVAVAPMYRIATAILDDETDETLITLLACFRSFDDMLLRDEMAACRRFWNFCSSVFVAQTDCVCEAKPMDCVCLRDRMRYGETVNPFRLGLDGLLQYYGNVGKWSSYTLVCGTDVFVNSMKTLLVQKLQVNEETIFVF